MLLVADAGNTQTVFGIWNGKSLLSSCRVSTYSYGTADEWSWMLRSWLAAEGGHFRHLEINEAIISSVVPSVTQELLSALQKLGASRIGLVHPRMRLPFTFDYENYLTLGADRIANAIAGVRFFGENLIIVDMGTAITFCLITQRVYRGGVIAPGVYTALRSLSERTAKLPEVSLQYRENALSKSTVASIEAGMYFGWRGLVRETIDSLLRAPEAIAVRGKIKIILTGGISEELGFSVELADVVDRQLTLRGLLAAREYLF